MASYLPTAEGWRRPAKVGVVVSIVLAVGGALLLGFGQGVAAPVGTLASNAIQKVFSASSVKNQPAPETQTSESSASVSVQTDLSVATLQLVEAQRRLTDAVGLLAQTTSELTQAQAQLARAQTELTHMTSQFFAFQAQLADAQSLNVNVVTLGPQIWDNNDNTIVNDIPVTPLQPDDAYRSSIVLSEMLCQGSGCETALTLLAQAIAADNNYAAKAYHEPRFAHLRSHPVYGSRFLALVGN